MADRTAMMPSPGEYALPWPAPAKLNLMLHITGRRDDGYHLLQTVFQLLDAGDSLDFEPTSAPDIRLAQPLPGLPEEQNLCVRAARLLQQETGYRGGTIIHLDKHLPLGGGLGGGSSDAATTLTALNHLWQLGLDRPALARLGARLGADVPVFVYGHSAWAEGIGERITPVELPERWYVVLIPPVSVRTAELFGNPRLTRDYPPIKIRAFLEGGACENAFETLACEAYPAIRSALEWLSGYGQARLTGTGSCVFAAFSARSSALEVLARRPSGIDGFVARGVNRSPLHVRYPDLA
jgi:4-diphosphocytidyl-2-C-methyl-D-erythritol kinase